MARLFVIAVLALTVSGCRLILRERASAPDVEVQRSPVAFSRGELRAKEIKVERVTAHVIYAKEIKMRGGRIGRHIRTDREPSWKGGQKKIKGGEVSASVIYAKEIHADWIDADEVYAKEIKYER